MPVKTTGLSFFILNKPKFLICYLVLMILLLTAVYNSKLASNR